MPIPNFLEQGVSSVPQVRVDDRPWDPTRPLVQGVDALADVYLRQKGKLLERERETKLSLAEMTANRESQQIVEDAAKLDDPMEMGDYVDGRIGQLRQSLTADEKDPELNHRVGLMMDRFSMAAARETSKLAEVKSKVGALATDNAQIISNTNSTTTIPEDMWAIVQDSNEKKRRDRADDYGINQQQLDGLIQIDRQEAAKRRYYGLLNTSPKAALDFVGRRGLEYGLEPEEVESMKNKAVGELTDIASENMARLVTEGNYGDAKTYAETVRQEGLVRNPQQWFQRETVDIDRIAVKQDREKMGVVAYLGGGLKNMVDLTDDEQRSVVELGDFAIDQQVRQEVMDRWSYAYDEPTVAKMVTDRQLSLRRLNGLPLPITVVNALDSSTNVTTTDAFAKSDDTQRAAISGRVIASARVYQQLGNEQGREWVSRSIKKESADFYDDILLGLESRTPEEATRMAILARDRRRGDAAPGSTITADDFNGAVEKLRTTGSWWWKQTALNDGDVRSLLFAEAKLIAEANGIGANVAVEEAGKRLADRVMIVGVGDGNGWMVNRGRTPLPQSIAAMPLDQQAAGITAMTDLVRKKYNAAHADDVIDEGMAVLVPDTSANGIYTLQRINGSVVDPVKHTDENSAFDPMELNRLWVEDENALRQKAFDEMEPPTPPGVSSLQAGVEVGKGIKGVMGVIGKHGTPGQYPAGVTPPSFGEQFDAVVGAARWTIEAEMLGLKKMGRGVASGAQASVNWFAGIIEGMKGSP